MIHFKKIVTFAALLISFSTAIYIACDIFFVSHTTEQQLQKIWAADIESLQKVKALPPAWNSIQFIEKTAGQEDLEAKTWIKNIVVPVSLNSKGEHKLEILFVAQTDEMNGAAVNAALIQHSIVSLKSGDTIWELTRLYELR